MLLAAMKDLTLFSSPRVQGQEFITINSNSTMNTDDTDKLHTSSYVKDKFSISSDAYHEMSILSNLPSLSEVRRLTKS